MNSIIGNAFWAFAPGIWFWTIFASRVDAHGLSRRQFASQICQNFVRTVPLGLGIVLILGIAIIPVAGPAYVALAAIFMLFAWAMVLVPVLSLILLNRRSWFRNWS